MKGIKTLKQHRESNLNRAALGDPYLRAEKVLVNILGISGGVFAVCFYCAFEP